MFCRTLSIAAAAIFALSSCSSVEVKTQKAKDANFAAYHTFRWANARDVEQIAKANPEGKKRLENFAAGRTVVANKNLDSIVQGKTGAVLSEDGLKQVPDDADADLLLTYFAFNANKSVTTNMAVGSTTAPYGSYYGQPYAPGTVPVTHSYKEGTLLIVMFDAKSLQPVWRGEATATVENDVNKMKERVDSAINDMLKDFKKA